jgi:hypothetical protein
MHVVYPAPGGPEKEGRGATAWADFGGGLPI